MTIPRDRLLQLLETMLLMRRVEEMVSTLGSQEIFGNYHLYIGQEATGASVISLLRPEDMVFSTHRCHGHAVARGIPLDQVMAELMLRATGASGGKGGTQHIMSAERRMVATSIVGSSTTLATGAALAAQVQTSRAIAVAFLGERSLSEGVVPEVFNLAGLWELPVLYVCENNAAGEQPNDPARSGLSLADLTDLPRIYGIVARSVDGTDPEAVDQAAGELVQLVREERRPAFLEARTPPLPTRARGESAGLDLIGLTDLRRAWQADADDPAAEWRGADPVLRAAKLALANGAITPDALLELDARVQAAVARATEAARVAPFPPAEGALSGVLAGGELWPN